MKKISLMKILVNIILFLEKIIPESIMNKIINFGIDRYINKYARLRIIGEEKLRVIKAPVIFICNHLSNADGLILNKVLKNQDVTFIMGVKLTQDPMTNLGCKIVKNIQITPSSPDKSAISNLVKHVRNGNNILIFPEGTRSRNGKMIKAKKGIYLIAKLCKVPIVPIAIYGSEKFMPIDKEGNMNNETFNNADVYVSIGDKINIPEKIKTETKEEFEERFINTLMSKISSMLPREYRGVYEEEV
ncbi:lysophospholipid acyltransferase family protein [Candidatus Arthromitus sp. SFB-rat-Yit]|uniref:lysophospholipid acyltransferase family protein n=1 Tax=Candidatus Arthromitus sp. SFB-rat-Yit TaxID=1041504 RepID=UPI000227A6EC|nr:lysophospholipid acyltransferase family protein [Candidatus Arthromitus sp. SFB-rat-Yit]BAK81698.1 phospholipid/glycerol acyltransferase [Candidatus Arthromitus sp. SFB-rat-Yit]